jgi:hypothetical protein
MDSTWAHGRQQTPRISNLLVAAFMSQWWATAGSVVDVWRKMASVQQHQKIASLVIIQRTCAAHDEGLNSPTKGSSVYLVEYSWYHPLQAPTPGQKSERNSTRHICSGFMRCCSKNSLHLLITKASSSFSIMRGLTPHKWPGTSSTALVGKFYPSPYSPDISPSDYHLFLLVDNHICTT